MTKPTPVVEFEEDDELVGMRVELSEPDARPEGAVRVRHVTGEPLSDSELQSLLGRLPDLHGVDGDRVPFAVRASSPPPPLTGTDVQTPFPPAVEGDGPASVEATPLQVVRFAPEGEVPLAPHVSVTFDQPMVAVTSQEGAASTVPVRLEPDVAGAWRWLGTRTVLFEAAVGPRLPMATEFRVVVPKGTAASSGQTLEADASFSFSTPAPTLRVAHPPSWPVQPLRPVIVVTFDQRVVPEQVAAHTRLVAGGDPVPLRLATDTELAADESAQRVATAAEPHRWVALMADVPLQPATSYQIEVGEGMPSAEGPRTTPAAQYGRFTTFDALKLTQHRCDYGDRCPPTSGWTLWFNNPLDMEAFEPTAFSVTPEVPGLSVRVYGDRVGVSGAFRARTTYTVTVPASLTDRFGQTLGEAETIQLKVGPADTSLSAPGDVLAVLDPSGGATLPIASVNHRRLKVKVHAVTPGDWGAWRKWLNRLYYDDARPGRLPGRQVYEGVLEPQGDADTQVETPLDFTEWLQDGHGQFVVLVEPPKQPRNRWERTYVARWVQVTDIGLVAFVDGQRMVGWATDLATGAPSSDVQLQLDPAVATVQTAADGLAELSLPLSAGEEQVLVARKGSDVAILPSAAGRWGGGRWVQMSQLDQVRWYVADDRGLYRPGETVSLFGWLRRFEPGPEGDLSAFDAIESVTWQLTGARGNEIAKGTAEVSPLGGFHLQAELPADANLGTAYVHVSVPLSGVAGTATSHPIQIQEFRRPEFEVTTSAAEGPHVLGTRTTLTVKAAYYAGGSLPSADVAWGVYGEDASYAPPGHGDFSFGRYSPWWWWGRPSSGSRQIANLQSTTDGAGEHRLGVHFVAMNPARPMTLRAEASVTDVNRQMWTSSQSVLVHPADVYVGLKTKATFVDKDTDVVLDLIAAGIDGEVVSKADLEVRMARLQGRWSGGRWTEVEADPQDCAVSTDSDGLAQCTFRPPSGGSYKVIARVRDAEGRPSESEMRVWVSGGERPPARNVELEAVRLIPEQDEVVAGQTARILVQAPFFPAQGVMTLRRSGLLRTERFRMEEPTTVIEVPIRDAHVPDLTVQVDLVGAAHRLDDDGNLDSSLPTRVAHATGQVTFQVPPLQRTLAVTATPADTHVAPGGQTSVTVVVSDAAGAAVADAEVALAVVDESVLALTGFQLPDPLTVFYAARGSGVSDERLRAFVALARAGDLVVPESEPVPSPTTLLGATGYDNGASGGPMEMDMMVLEDAEASGALESKLEFRTRARRQDKSKRDGFGARGEANAQQPIAVRSDFSATALFAPGKRTDAEGRVSVDFQVPDSLTRYRVMVVAVDADRSFGATDAAITARLPLMVRPSAPRFLNFGDQVELPIVLQNQTDDEISVDVGVRGTNVRFVDAIAPSLPDLPDTSVSSSGRRVTVPPQDRVEVRFPMATLMAGTARLQAVGVTGAGEDAALLSLPVWTPATSEAFATYGEIDEGGLVQPIEAPSDVWTQFGGLEVTTSSTQLHALTDAVLYLSSYPFECNEQLASRLMGIAALRDVLDAFEAEGLPDADALQAQVQSDIARLAQRQNYDGGFAFWRRGDPSWPYLSIHVAHAYARARERGYEVPEVAWRRSLDHLRDIESHIPHWYSQRTKWFLRAYALDVRRRMSDADPGEARRLYVEAGSDGLGLDAQAFLLPTLHEGGAKRQATAILRTLGNSVSETAAAAHFVTQTSDGEQLLLHSDRRADGIVLERLIEVQPSSDLIPKVVRGLLGHRTRGRWLNTQENAFVLLAMDRYFRVFEKQTPDFVARMWLGDGHVADTPFRGRSTERVHTEVPMGYLTEASGSQPLTLVKDGTGRLYYRIGMRYAPRDLKLEPADYGFAVERRYEALDDPEDVQQDADGTWRIRAGAPVRVRVTMVAEGRRNHVALVDPLPAGLEVSNPELATTGTLPQGEPADLGPYWWWTRTWYEHENLRDERVEAFTSLLWSGVHEYTYVARATTPGRYVVPPPRAEEMYHPETFGRGATARVVIE
ncbi:MAG: hypothetical protein KTR31_39905 [Myxococcales bacterium]|nr:hypothetical protein [Myxococcales bacterium]